MSRIKRGYLLMNKKKFPVYEGVNLIGRSKQSTVMILENTVSHQQAEIIIINDKHYVCDMNSCNGTQLEHGKLVPLQLYELDDKKILYFGNIKVVYELLLHKSNSQDDSQYSQVNDSVFDIPTQMIPDNETISINTNIELETTGVNNIDVPTIHELPTQLIDDNDLDVTPNLNVEFKIPDTSKTERCTEISQQHASIYDMPTQIIFVPDESKQINEELKDIPDKSWDEDFFTKEPTQSLCPNIIQEKGLGQGDDKDKEQPKTSLDEETREQTAPNELSVIDDTVVNETIQNDDGDDANSNCSEDFLNVIPVTELFDDIAANDVNDKTPNPPDSSLTAVGLSIESSQEPLQTTFLKRKIKNVVTSDNEYDENDETHVTPASSADNHPCSLRVDLLKRKVRNVINSDSESSDETDIDVTQQKLLKERSESSDETDLDLKIDKNKNKRKKKLVKKQSHKKDDQKPCSGSETDMEYGEKVNNNQLDESDFVPASQNCFVNSLSSFQKNTKLSQSSNKSKESNSQTSIDFSLDLMLTESFTIEVTKNMSDKLPTIQENNESLLNQTDLVEDSILMPAEDLDVQMKGDESKDDIIDDKGNQKNPAQLVILENSQNKKNDIENLEPSKPDKDIPNPTQELIDSDQPNKTKGDDEIFLEPTQPATTVNSCTPEDICSEAMPDISSDQTNKSKDDEIVLEPIQPLITANSSTLEDVHSEATRNISSDQPNKSKDDEIFLEPTQPLITANPSTFGDVRSEAMRDISSDQPNKSKDDEIVLEPTQPLIIANSSTLEDVRSEATRDISSDKPNISTADEIFLEPTQPLTTANSSTLDDVRSEATRDISSDKPNKSKDDDDIFLEPTQPVTAVNSSASEDVHSEATRDISSDQPNKSKDDDDIFLEPTQPVSAVNSSASEDVYSKGMQDISSDQVNKSKDDEIFLEPTQPLITVNSCTSEDVQSEAMQDISCDQPNKSKDNDEIFLEPTQPVLVLHPSTSRDKDVYSEPTQEIVSDQSNTSKDTDDIFLEPTQLVIAVNSSKSVDTDIYSEPTQEIVSDQSNTSKDDDDIFLEPTQLVTKESLEMIKVNNDKNVFLEPKIPRNLGSSKKTRNVVDDDDDIFLVATQPVLINDNNPNHCVPNDLKKQDGTKKLNKIDEDEDDIFIQPTQLVAKNVSNTDDDDIFLEATQPVLINDNNPNDLKKVYVDIEKLNKKNENDDDIFSKVTQPVVANNALQRTSKLEICKFPVIQIRDDLYEARCSKTVDTVEESMEKMFQSQPIKDDLNDINRNSVESQMEILFASQLPNTKSDCRPQNPLANILENLQSQNEMIMPLKHNDEIKQEKEDEESKSKPAEISDVKQRIKSGKKSEKNKDNDEDINKVREKRKTSRKKSKNEDELLEILQASKIEKEKARRHAHKIQNEAGTSKEKNVSTHSKIKPIHLEQPELSSSIEKPPIDSVAKKSEYIHKIKVAPQSNNPEIDILKQKKSKITPDSPPAHEKCPSPIDPKKSGKVKELKPEKITEIEHEDLPKRKSRLRNKSVGGTPEEDIKTDIHKIKKKNSSRLEPDDLKENKHNKTENNNTNKTEHEHKEHRNTDKQESDQKIPSKRSHRTKKSPNPLPQPIDKTIGDSIIKQSSNKTINLSGEEPNVPFGDNSDPSNETQRSKRKANTINTNKAKLRKHKNDGELSLIDELPEYSDSTDNSIVKAEVVDLTDLSKNVNEMKSTRTSKRAAVVKEDENIKTRQKQRRRSSTSEDDFIVKVSVKRSKLDVSKRDLSPSSNTSDVVNLSGALQTPERSRRKLKPKVVFTMMENPELESLIRRLGGSVVDTVDSSTILMTMNVKRSLKLLTAIGQGKPICAPEWLEECKKANQFLDPWDFILRDPEAETKWNFSLKESLNRSRSKKIFENYFFLLLTNVALDVLKGSIEACGGKSAQRCPPKYQNIQNFVVVSQQENRTKYSKYLKQDPHPIIIHYEAVLDAILRQEINFDKHFLT
ncbi:mediator of DNA damage checkpoint protein 1-like isoform X2 [Onthophagus taurus]|uniref:mediator of DNA damage checkpoint protein 1-like isoform X2 n=1 Tax=Onthophagus taurus TaxID=166361 RepID=UPI0039BECCCA